MLKSNLIPMITQGKQLTIASLAVSYVYANTGEHVDGGSGVLEAAQIKFYGHDRTGRVFIAKGHLVTGGTGTYVGGKKASCVITDIPIKADYPYVSWELVPKGDFVRLEGQPQMGIAISDMEDDLPATIKSQADLVLVDA